MIRAYPGWSRNERGSAELSEDAGTGPEPADDDAVLLFVGGPLDGRVEIRKACHGDPLPTVTHVHLHGGPAPVRRYLPELIQLILDRKIEPGKVFDKRLPLEEAAEAYRLMDQREAIKVLLEV